MNPIEGTWNALSLKLKLEIHLKRIKSCLIEFKCCQYKDKLLEPLINAIESVNLKYNSIDNLNLIRSHNIKIGFKLSKS